MEYRRELYKSTKITSAQDARARRLKTLNAGRHEGRMKLLESRRGSNLFEPEVPVIAEPKNLQKTRAQMLQQWKMEKAKKIEELKKKQKPVFKVGVIQTTATGSPIAGARSAFIEQKRTNTNQLNPRIGVVTRSRAKQTVSTTQSKPQSVFSQIANNKEKPIKRHAFVVPKSVALLPYCQKMTIPCSPKITKSSKKTPRAKHTGESEVSAKYVTKKNDVEKLGEKLKNVLSTATALEEHSSPEPSSEYVPIHYSPFVTKTRGSIRKSPRNTKINLTMNVDEQIEKEESEFKCRIFSFRKFLECHTNRLSEICDNWEKIQEANPQLPQEIQGDIASAIGKTKLLTSDKFKQFKSLIEKCQNEDPMVKIDDLQGFQDWVSIEIERVDESFSKLATQKENNWQVRTVQAKENKVAKFDKNSKENKKPAKQPAARSNIRAHILAARKIMNEKTNNFGCLNSLETWAEASSPVKTPRRKDSMIRDVLNSETKRNSGLIGTRRSGVFAQKRERLSGFEVMLVSQKLRALTPGKSPSLFLNQEPAFVKAKVTPAKSILKSTSISSSTKKRSVAFDLCKSTPDTPQGLDEKYFEPADEDDDFASPVCAKPIQMSDVSSSTPSIKRKSKTFVSTTPARKSARLASKN